MAMDSEADVGPSDEPPGGSYGPEDTSAVSTPTQSRVDLTNADSFRTVYINDPVKNDDLDYISNYVSTAKYTALTFLPKFLYEQFTRSANLFFLFIACIQQVPGVSPTGHFTTIIPLSVVLFATAIKEILEDLKRHRSDKDVNDRLVRVLREGTFQTVTWEEVQVGDLVRVIHDQFFPADLILLSSSEPQGICYVETANLDGETNLKIKQSCGLTNGVKSAGDARFLRGVIRCERPNNRLYNFEGVLTLHEGGAEKKVSLGPDQVLLRGAQLRNTPWIYGIAIFTGMESKLMMNATAAPIKRTQMERTTNFQILFLFSFLLLISFLSTIGSILWKNSNQDTHWYLGFQFSSPENPFKTFLTFIILYNNLIPISLYITLEIVKYIQALVFINNDLDMYYEPNDTPAVVRTSNLNEELGAIQYIFSDKTGTLTRNIMELRKLTIAGVSYGAITGEKAPPGVPSEVIDKDGNLNADGFHDPALLDNLTTGHGTAPVIRQFLTILAVCHTVIPEASKEDPDTIYYQAQSPDEGALVGAVKKLGFSFNVRTPRSVVINVLGVDEEYEVLNVLEFDSTRKRMSVIVRSPQGNIQLMCKGADTVVYERLAENQPYADVTLKHLEAYAQQGLRTLCIAMTELDEDTYTNWARMYEEATQALTDRERRIHETCDMIEQNLFLLGASAIEDKLQDKVPETISNLLEAGIKIWMLTGDKQETAINIGYSCELISDQMNIMVCNTSSRSETIQWLKEKAAGIRKIIDKETAGLALVIDGHSLGYALEDELRGDLLEISLVCRAVICCRVSPLQKAEVVNLVKNRCGKITLAIGDGANDVSMIQAAHVGVGISGQEGLQAARAADYAIAQFRYLQKLLLVHGHVSHRRIAKLILYSFYKNIVLYIIQFWFQIVNGFSGQILFDEWMIAFYNVAFTFLPPLCIGVFDRQVRNDTLMRVPQLYRAGLEGSFLNVRVFWQWVINAMFHSAIVFWIVLAAFANAAVFGNGQTVGQWTVGTTVYTAVFLTATFKAALIMDAWVIWTHVSIWGSIAIYFIFLLVYCIIWPNLGYTVAVNVFHVDYQMFSCAPFWFAIIAAPLVALTRDFWWKTYQRLVSPQDYHIIQEMEYMEKDPLVMKSAFSSFGRVLRKIPFLSSFVTRGYAFSQEEKRANHMGQADLIRQYDTTKDKPEG